MGIKTAIKYCDSSVNPVMGCTGCELLGDHCYAHRLCRRYAGRKGWPKSFTTPEHFPGRLEAALGWKDLTGTKRPDKPWLDGMPRVIFVNDMSDGFCPGGVDPSEWLESCFTAMALSPHIWLLLTKWPGRMRAWMDQCSFVPHNFWLGTTVMRQSDEWRLEELLKIKRVRGKRWVSGEPLLGGMNLENYLGIWTDGIIDGRHQRLVVGRPLTPNLFTALAKPAWATTLYERQLDLVIAGGETGPGARIVRPERFQSIRDQCQVAGIDFFFKQWGEWMPVSQSGNGWGNVPAGTPKKLIGSKPFVKMRGHLLDGRAWRQMPEVTP